jgi:carboxylesterase
MLPAVRQPILIIHGRLDRSVDPSAPQEVLDRVGSAEKELLWLSRSAHCVALDCERQQVFEATREFLARHLARRWEAADPPSPLPHSAP